MTMTMIRVAALSILPVTVSMLAACQQPAEEPFAKVVPSAVIEIRDEPTQAELDKKTQVDRKSTRLNSSH
jgi:hypothetical protein